MREINGFGPQARDSCIMRESWQVYDGDSGDSSGTGNGD